MVEARIKNLSQEQRMAVELVKLGMTNIEIAVELGYSPDGVKKLLSRLYKKLGVRRRVELAMLFFRADC